MFSEKCTMIKTKVKKIIENVQKKVEVQNALMEKMHKKTIRKYQDNTQNVKNALAILWLSI